MIDKKPFRVMNEQLEDIANGENYGVECDEVNDTNIHAIVSDLQDAHELNDKQEALIKEMRKVLKHIQYEYDPYFQDIDSADIDSILEKTKDYAS